MVASTIACTSPNPCTSLCSDSLEAGFLALLPKIQTHAQIFFRHIVCPATKADKVAETIALAWKWYCRLRERGKDVRQFPMAFCFVVARAVKSGRRLCGMEPAKDVLSPAAQQRHGFKAESLPTSTRRSYHSIQAVVKGQQEMDAYEERLQDNLVTPPPEAAAFRIDFPEFLSGLSERDRDLAMYLSLGHRPSKAANKFGLSPGRVTHLRQAWCRGWNAFQGEEGAGTATRIPAQR
jgi:hypothetical protein